MDSDYDLSKLASGCASRVAEVCGPDGMRRRLEDIGFTRGAAVRCLFEAPSGEPRAYSVRGAVIALRQADAELVRVIKESSWD